MCHINNRSLRLAIFRDLLKTPLEDRIGILGKAPGEVKSGRSNLRGMHGIG
jgi:hypothetical protein